MIQNIGFNYSVLLVSIRTTSINILKVNHKQTVWIVSQAMEPKQTVLQYRITIYCFKYAMTM